MPGARLSFDGCLHMWVNASSVGLHASLGFRQVGLLPEAGNKFGEWLRLLIMQRLLQSDFAE
jgi:L-amino acid N-acyltransferase YncA